MDKSFHDFASGNVVRARSSRVWACLLTFSEVAGFMEGPFLMGRKLNTVEPRLTH